MSKRAVGVVRVSRVKGREGDSFRSPEDQRSEVAKLCDKQGWKLADVHEEMDVSGAKTLHERPGLTAAAESVERGRAEIVVVGYFDRLVRSPRTREDFVDRVEAAGGEVWTADLGKTSNGTAAQRFVGGVLAEAARFVRDSAAEKARAAQVAAVEQGTWMSPQAPLGYRVGEDRRLEIDPVAAPVVREAFRMRAEESATIEEVRLFLRGHGIERTYGAVSQLLRSRAYLGELRFGDDKTGLHNPEAHEPLIERATWERVQQTSAPRGPKPPSDRLLARAKLLRCGACGARMSVTTQTQRGKVYPGYRCSQHEYCAAHTSISATAIESYLTDALLAHVGALRAEGSPATDALSGAEGAVEAAERELQAYLEGVQAAGLEPGMWAQGAKQRRETLEAAQSELAKVREQAGLADLPDARHLATSWPGLSIEERRKLLRAAIKTVLVHKGRASIEDRVEITWHGEDLPSGYSEGPNGRLVIDFEQVAARMRETGSKVAPVYERILRERHRGTSWEVS